MNAKNTIADFFLGVLAVHREDEILGAPVEARKLAVLLRFARLSESLETSLAFCGIFGGLGRFGVVGLLCYWVCLYVAIFLMQHL